MKIVCVQSPKHDFLTSTLIEGLLQLGHHIIATEQSNHATRTPTRRLRKCLEDADLIVVFSNDRVNYSILFDSENPNKVFVDGSDSQYFAVPSFIRFKAVFKRELSRYWINQFDEPIFPLPFAAEAQYFKNRSSKRDISVSYAATMHTAFRQSVYHFLVQKNVPFSFVGTTIDSVRKGRLSRSAIKTEDNYRDILSRSSISVNVAGGGYDCARYWEILAAGALLLTQELEIEVPAPFRDGRECVTFNSITDLSLKLDMLLSNPVKVSEMRNSGYQHLLRHHTTLARATYFLDCLRDIPREKNCSSFFCEARKSLLAKYLNF
ncbi:MAG: glycosyltransferase family 1 protein [Betaproteobacteria bacterium]|nr:glycosyltransferase family 1 protein [Betaproteobacteria bacterium]